jgi:adenine/guanine phosphoribosyltransferase-like PRPP-binding protein
MNNKDWIETFENEEEPVRIKNRLLDLSSSCFRMISEDLEDKSWPMNHEKHTMEEFLEIAKFGVRGFYQGRLESEVVKKEIKNFLRKNINLDPYRAIVQRHLENKEEAVRNFMLDLKDYEFDVTIPVMNGGLEPALLVKSRDGIIPVRYSTIKYSDKEPYVPPCYEKDLKGDIEKKSILITEDIIATGESILGIAGLVKSLDPEELYLSTVKWEGGEICGNEKIKDTLWRYV